jgi:hypothetical protein
MLHGAKLQNSSAHGFHHCFRGALSPFTPTVGDGCYLDKNNARQPEAEWLLARTSHTPFASSSRLEAPRALCKKPRRIIAVANPHTLEGRQAATQTSCGQEG